MKLKHLFAIALCCVIGLTAAAQNSSTTSPQTSAYRLSGPYTHNNLTVFLVHGKDQTSKTFLTLQEALAQKKVRVYETKDVNELAIRNFSNQDVYVQAGDMVRGGEQDRMISVDFIVPPRSGRMPIAAYCVESGRWNSRGNEAPGDIQQFGQLCRIERPETRCEERAVAGCCVEERLDCTGEADT